ncbi:hypothetical protein [Kitasatospora brasiliensis]|uniref:hypothetical protein n=1 Tax=Kitasatospora brasiliensis TaxID=3058040 RepID=UPI002930C3BE|nr:hypothetical protein [Kitasatospora sp. K002]
MTDTTDTSSTTDTPPRAGGTGVPPARLFLGVGRRAGTAGTAGTARAASTAGIASTAGTASTAETASTAKTAGTAGTAVTAETASTAESAVTVETASTAETLPEVYAPLVALIREAMEAGDVDLATHLAEELYQRVVRERGALHPEALRAQEVRAYVAAVGGDPQRAADLFTGAAAAWAGLGAVEQWAASRNAEVCRRRAELVASEPQVVPVLPAARRRPAVSPSLTRVFGRGTVVAVVLATALVTGATEVGQLGRFGADQRVASDDQLVVPALVAALDFSVPSDSWDPDLEADLTEEAEDEPAPEAKDAVPADGQEAADPDGDASQAGRAQAPGSGRRHDAPAAHPRPRPAPGAGHSSGGHAGPTDAELCATARTYGGQFLGSLVDLCQRAAGVSGKRSLAPELAVREGTGTGR